MCRVQMMPMTHVAMEEWYLSGAEILSAALGGCRRQRLVAFRSLQDAHFQRQAGGVDNLAQCT